MDGSGHLRPPVIARPRGGCGKIPASQPGAKMERINLYDFFELGRRIHPLTDLQGDHAAGQAYFPLSEAQDAVQKLLAGSPVRLGFCGPAATELRDAIGFTWRAFFVDRSTGQFRFPEASETIPSWHFHRIRDAAQNFEAVLRAEMTALATYLVPKKPGQDMGDLVDRAHEMIPEDVREIVGPKVRDEIQLAGRCKAFGLYTASGYHVCRAVEAITERYYQLFSGKDGATRRSWDDYVKALQKLAEGDAEYKPSERTMRALLQMKDLDRNPLMHPREVLNETDASLLFDIGKVSIIVMAHEMMEATGEPELPLEPQGALPDLSALGIAGLLGKAPS